MKIIRNLELFCQKVNLAKKINQNSEKIVKFLKKAKNNNLKFNCSKYKKLKFPSFKKVLI